VSAALFLLEALRGRTCFMSAPLIGLLGFAGLFALMALGTPVGIAMLVTGFWARCADRMDIGGLHAVGADLSVASYYELSVLPLFILMGNLAAASGLSRDLYDAAYRWIGHVRGGLGRRHRGRLRGFAALSGRPSPRR
jgi:TRAP-type mannitol/chloroaromatic compound transport system permease large subunit